MTVSTTRAAVAVRALNQGDLQLADRICRTAFGTFVGVPEPETFFGDADYVNTRFASGATAALAAERAGELVGTNFVTNWGSLGFFGPLSVRVDLWDEGIASRLMEATMDVFTNWGTRHACLFTWATSPKHHGLYQKFGFYPTFLTAVMSKTPNAATTARWTKYSDVSQPDRPALLAEGRRLTDSIFDALDLSREIRTVHEQQLGDTILLWEDAQLAGLAVCHVGARTEAGGDTCFVKFAGVRSGTNGPRDFERLVDACETYAADSGAGRIVAGVSMGRLEAYRMLGARGYRSDLTGVAMQQAGDHAYNRPGVFVIDDWR